MKRRDVLTAIVGSPIVGALIGRPSDAVTHADGGRTKQGVCYMAFSEDSRIAYRGIFSSPAEAAKAFIVDARVQYDDHLTEEGYDYIGSWERYRDEEMERIWLTEISMNAIDHCRIGKDGTPEGQDFRWFNGEFKPVAWNEKVHGFIPIVG